MDSFARSFNASMFVFLGVLFRIGAEIHIGVNDIEPMTIPIPQNVIVGWLFITLAFVYALPPAWTIRTFKFIKKRIKDSELVPNIKVKFGGKQCY